MEILNRFYNNIKFLDMNETTSKSTTIYNESSFKSTNPYSELSETTTAPTSSNTTTTTAIGDCYLSPCYVLFDSKRVLNSNQTLVHSAFWARVSSYFNPSFVHQITHRHKHGELVLSKAQFPWLTAISLTAVKNNSLPGILPKLFSF